MFSKNPSKPFVRAMKKVDDSSPNSNYLLSHYVVVPLACVLCVLGFEQLLAQELCLGNQNQGEIFCIGKPVISLNSVPYRVANASDAVQDIVVVNGIRIIADETLCVAPPLPTMYCHYLATSLILGIGVPDAHINIENGFYLSFLSLFSSFLLWGAGICLLVGSSVKIALSVAPPIKVSICLLVASVIIIALLLASPPIVWF